MHDDDGVLKAFILDNQRFLGVIDEISQALAATAWAPDEIGIPFGFESLTFPIRLETVNNLSYFHSVAGEHGAIARFAKVLWFPIEGLHECHRLVHHHRFLMGDAELRVALLDFYTTIEELLRYSLVVVLPSRPIWVEDYAGLHPPMTGVNQSPEHLWIRKREYFDANGLVGDIDRVKYWPCRVIG